MLVHLHDRHPHDGKSGEEVDLLARDIARTVTSPEREKEDSGGKTRRLIEDSRETRCPGYHTDIEKDIAQGTLGGIGHGMSVEMVKNRQGEEKVGVQTRIEKWTSITHPDKK